MIASIASTTVYVSDQDRALDFYVNLLGSERRAATRCGDDQHWREVAPPGTNAAIVLALGCGGKAAAAGQFAGIVFGTDDIHETDERLRARSVLPCTIPSRRSTIVAWTMSRQGLGQSGAG